MLLYLAASGVAYEMLRTWPANLNLQIDSVHPPKTGVRAAF